MVSIPSCATNPDLVRLALISALTLTFVSVAQAQTLPSPSASPRPPSDTRINQDKEDSSIIFGSPEHETRAKLLLKEEKKKYSENLARAREVCEIASQLDQRYASSHAFTADDGKRLERLEKLAKRIRNEAGGSDPEANADVKDIGNSIKETVKRLAELADELQKLVEKTPRNVVSAAVIDQANRVIGLARHLRPGR
jgi:hypothetical protein